MGFKEAAQVLDSGRQTQGQMQQLRGRIWCRTRMGGRLLRSEYLVPKSAALMIEAKLSVASQRLVELIRRWLQFCGLKPWMSSIC